MKSVSLQVEQISASELYKNRRRRSKAELYAYAIGATQGMRIAPIISFDVLREKSQVADQYVMMLALFVENAMSARLSEYKGFDISAGANQLTGADRYVSTLTISRHDGVACAGRSFSSGYFNNASDAMKSATSFARAVIDGRIARVTIAGM